MQFNQTNNHVGEVHNRHVLTLKTGPFVRLRDLRRGAVFETLDGVRALKTEYRTFNECTQCDCYLLASGEAAHFQNKDEELVREIILP